MRDGKEPFPEPSEDDDFTSAPLDPGAPSRRRSPLSLRGAQRRMLALATSALLVSVVAMGLFAHATSDPRGAITTLLRLATPTPFATFVPGANVIYFSDAAPWGALTIDGKRQPQADLAGYAMTVGPGPHDLDYAARYFPSRHCTFSAPQQSSDTCPLDTSNPTLQFLLDKGLARAIDLGSTGATLQPDQQQALIQLANTQLALQGVSAPIAPGDRYLDAQGRMATATAPLRFTLSESLGGAGLPGASQTCVQFCPDQRFLSGPPTPADDGWLTYMSVTPMWGVSDANGAYQVGQPNSTGAQTEVDILLTPDGWRISGLADLNIQAIETTAGDYFVAMVNKSASLGAGYSAEFFLASNPLAGCVLVTTIGGVTARLFWRFGILFTLDAAAQKFFPQAPIANAREQAAAANASQSG